MPPTKVADRLLSWASDIEPDTIAQAERTARLPFIDGHVALMPDAHIGMGATVGSVIPTRGAIIPAAVGVDIGCGMIAAELPFTSAALPDDLHELHSRIARVVPAGVGQGHDRAVAGFELLPSLTTKQAHTATRQLGSLGSGNHFVEVCLDETDAVWVVLHSGSRGIGKQLADVHITRAKGLMRSYFIELEDPDLAYLVQGTAEFDAYIEAMQWAQDYAMANRATMMAAVLDEVRDVTDPGAQPRRVVNCHHNFTEPEHHHGRNVWVTRKGAIRAREGDWGVIPGSMGTRSYIVEGLGNPASYCSCSHGAGRRMSRGQARRRLDLEGLRTAMAGKAWNDADAERLIDEDPRSYKDIDQVMEDQRDLVRVDRTLQQILNYKGV